MNTPTPSTSFPKGRIESLKRTATRLKRAEGITHTEALDRVAQGEGFSNWSQLTRLAAT